MAVASIAAYDWPEDWPDLLPYLLKLINDQNNMNGGKPFLIHDLHNLLSFCLAVGRTHMHSFSLSPK